MRCMAVQRDSYRSVWHMGICAPSTSMSATPCVSDIMWSSGTGTRRPVETGREQTSEDVVLGKKKKKKWGEGCEERGPAGSWLLTLTLFHYHRINTWLMGEREARHEYRLKYINNISINGNLWVTCRVVGPWMNQRRRANRCTMEPHLLTYSIS